MILVTMGDKETFDLVLVLFQVRNVRDNQVDSQHVILWECKSAIHDNNAFAIFESSDVHSNLFQSAQRNDFQFSSILLLFFVQNIPPVVLFSLHLKVSIFHQLLKNLYDRFKLHIVLYHFISGVCVICRNFF